MSGSRVFSLLLLCGVLLSVRLKAQTLHVCADQVEHSTCEIVCITPDHAQTVAFYKLPNTGTEIAQCISFVGCFNTSPYTITQPNSTATVLTFILTRSLIGSYRCNYGSLFSNETLHWGTYPSNTLVTGVTNGSEIESVDEFMVYLHCFYSEHEPTITLFYKDEQGNVDATSDLFSCANSTTSSCPHDSDFTSYDCPCRLRHKTGIDCKDIYDVNGYITISNIESMWNTSIVDDITFPCQMTTAVEIATDSSNEQTTISQLPYMSFSYSIDKTVDKTTKDLHSSTTMHEAFTIATHTTSVRSESDQGDKHIHLKTVVFTYTFCGIIFLLTLSIIIYVAIHGANKENEESNTKMGITDFKHFCCINCDNNQTNINLDEQMGYKNSETETNSEGKHSHQMKYERDSNYFNDELTFYYGSNKPARKNENVEFKQVNAWYKYHDYGYGVQYHDVYGQKRPSSHLQKQASDLQGYSFYRG